LKVLFILYYIYIINKYNLKNKNIKGITKVFLKKHRKKKKF